MRLRKALLCVISLVICIFSCIFCISCKKAEEDRGEFSYTHTAGIADVGGEGLYEYEYVYFYSQIRGEVPESVKTQGYDEEVMKSAQEYKAKAVLARKNGIKFGDEEIADLGGLADQYLTSLYNQENKGDFTADSEDIFIELYRGVTRDEFRKIYIERIYGERYVEEVAQGAESLSDDELLLYYQEHISDFRSVELMTAYFSFNDESGSVLSEADVQKKLGNIESLLSRVDGEESMSEFIEKNSEIYAEDDTGGIKTYYSHDESMKDFAEFCEDDMVKIGDKAIIHTETGFYAVYCSYVEDYLSEGVKEAVLEAATLESVSEKVSKAVDALLSESK